MYIPYSRDTQRNKKGILLVCTDAIEVKKRPAAVKLRLVF